MSNQVRPCSYPVNADQGWNAASISNRLRTAMEEAPVSNPREQYCTGSSYIGQYGERSRIYFPTSVRIETESVLCLYEPMDLGAK